MVAGEFQKILLFMITFLGGGFGTIAGMYKFRHKTKKLRFTICFPVILLTEIVFSNICISKICIFKLVIFIFFI